MAQSHLLNRLRDAFWLLPVKSNRATCLHSTETATTRTDTSQDHEGSCFISPAFANIWAASLLADGMQSFAAHQLLQIIVVFSPGRTHPEPFRTALWYHGRHVVFLLAGDREGRPYISYYLPQRYINIHRFHVRSFAIWCVRLVRSPQLRRHPGYDGRTKGRGTSWSAQRLHHPRLLPAF